MNADSFGRIGLSSARWLVVIAVCVFCCRREPPPASKAPAGSADRPAPAGAASTRAALPARTASSAPVDFQDDPNTPGFLPRSEQFGRWVRHAGARVAGAGQVGKLIGDEERVGIVTSYAIERMTTCAYRWDEGKQPLIAHLEIIEAGSPLDALGLLTVHCLAADNGKAGVVTRFEHQETVHFYSRQGPVFLHLRTAQKDEPFLDNCRQFVVKLMFRIPAEEAPAWLNLLPVSGQIPGHRWVVRRTRSLRAACARSVPVGNHDRVDEFLGLGADSALVVGAYEVPGETPNYVWLVRYPAPERARAAHKRYKAFIDTSGQRFADNTLLETPQGNFLLGTWTADQESLTHVLPRIAESIAR